MVEEIHEMVEKIHSSKHMCIFKFSFLSKMAYVLITLRIDLIQFQSFLYVSNFSLSSSFFL